jgi:hypothetical protein
MRYYSAIKNEIMSSVGKWMEVEIMTLSKIRLRKTNVTCFLLYVESSFFVFCFFLKRGTLSRRESIWKEKGTSEEVKKVYEGEYNQSTLYTCIKYHSETH